MIERDYSKYTSENEPTRKAVADSIRLNEERIDDSLFQSDKETWESIQAKRLAEGRNKRIKAYSGIPDDSDIEMTAKDAYNSFINWSSKVFTGEGADDSSLFDINYRGSKISSLNKDLGAYKDKTLTQLKSEYDNAKDDPKARHVVYTLKIFDGYNPDGSSKYLYKTGVDEVSAFNRYKEQMDDFQYEIVDEKRFAGAEQWENAFNMLAHGDRAVDKGKDKASGINFGSGYTELLTRDVLGVDRKGEDYKQNRSESISDYESYIKDGLNEDGSKKSDSAWNAFASGSVRLFGEAGEGIVSLVDDLPEWVADKAYESITGKKIDRTINEFGVKIKEEKGFFRKIADNADKTANYDRRLSDTSMTESINDWKNGRRIQALFGLSNIGGHFNALAESGPEMAVFMLAPELMFGKASIATANAVKGLESASRARAALGAVTEASSKKLIIQEAKLSKEIAKNERIILALESRGASSAVGKESKQLAKLNKKKIKTPSDTDRILKLEASIATKTEALTASGALNAASEAKAIIKAVDMSATQKALYATAGNYGFDAIWIKNVNNAIDRRIENGDEDISIAEAFAISSGLFVSTALDKLVDTAIIGGAARNPVFKEYMSKAMQFVPQPVRKSLVGKLTKSIVGSGISATSEAGQEYLQTWAEILASEAGTDKGDINDVLNNEENKDRVIGASIAGAFGGGVMHVGFSSIRSAYNKTQVALGRKPNPDQQILIDAMIQQDANARERIKTDADLNGDNTSIYEKEIALRAHLNQDDDFYIETDKSSAELVDILRDSIHGSIMEDFDKNSPRSDVDMAKNAEMTIESKKFADEKTGDMLSEIAFNLLIKADSGDKEAGKVLLDNLLGDENIGSHVKKSMVYRAESYGKVEFAKIFNKSVSDETKESGSDTILESNKNNATKNPVKGKLSTLILTMKQSRETLISKNITKEDSQEIKELDAQIKLLNKYNSVENYNFYDKSITDIGTEIGTLGTVRSDGTIDPVSIKDYENNYYTSINSKSINSPISIESMDEFIAQRATKHAPRSDGSRHTNQFMKKIVDENSRLEKVIRETLNHTTDAITRKKLQKQLDQITSINNNAMNMMYSIGNVVDNGTLHSAKFDGNVAKKIISEIDENDKALDDKTNGITSNTHFQKVKEIISSLSLYNISHNDKKSLFDKIMLSLDKNDGPVKKEDNEPIKPATEKDFRKISDDLNNARTEDDVRLIFQNATEKGNLSGEQQKQLHEHSVYSLESIKNNQQKVTFEELGSIEESLNNAKTQSEFLTLKSISDNKRLTYYQRIDLNEVIKKNEKRLRDDSNIEYDLKKDSTFLRTENESNLKENELSKIESNINDINNLKELSRKISEDNEEYSNLNEFEKNAIKKEKESLIKSINLTNRKIDKYQKIIDRDRTSTAVKLTLVTKIKKMMIGINKLIARTMKRITTLTKDVDSKVRMLDTINRYLDNTSSVEDAEQISKVIKKRVVKDSESLTSVENVSKVSKSANKALNQLHRNKIVEGKDGSRKLDEQEVTRDVTSRELAALAELKKKSTESSVYKYIGMGKSLVKMREKLALLTGKENAGKRKNLNKKIDTLNKKILDLKHSVNKTNEEAKTLDEVSKIISTENSIISTEKLSIARELTSKLTLDGQFKSNGEMILENTKSNLSEFFKISKANGNPIGNIPSLVSLFHIKDIQDELRRSIGDKKYNEMHDELLALNKVIRKIKITEPNVYLDEDGTLTYINDSGKLLTRNANEDLIDVIEILSEYKKDATGNNGKLILPEPIQEAIKVGILAIIGSTDRIRGNIMNSDLAEIMKDTQIPTTNGAKKYKDQIMKGNIPEALYRKEIESLVSDIIGLSTKNNVDNTAKDALVKSLLAHIIEQLKEQNVLTQEIQTMDFGGNRKFRMIRINNTKVKKSIGEIDTIKDGTMKMNFISGTHSKNSPKRNVDDIETDSKYKNSSVSLSEDQISSIKDREKTEWRYSENTIRLKNKYNESEEGKAEVLKSFGYINIDTDVDSNGVRYSDMNVSKVQVIQAVNQKIEYEAESLFRYHDEFEGNPFHIKHNISVAGRTAMSSELTVMDSKIHRSFLYSDAYKGNVDLSQNQRDIKDIDIWNMTSLEKYVVAIGQGFDLDPDKLGKHGFFKSVRGIFNYTEKDGLKINKEKYPELNDFVTAKEFDIKLLNKALDSFGFPTSSRMHLHQAIVSLRGFDESKRNGKTHHKTTMWFEADAITSGSMIQQLLLGTKNAFRMLEKGGIWDDAAKSKWTEYTKKLLSNKHGVPESEIELDAGALFEAGKYHNQLIREGKKDKIFNVFGDITTLNHIFKDNEAFKDTYLTTGTRAFEIKNEKISNGEGKSSSLEMLMNKTLDDDINSKGLFKVLRGMSKYPTMHDGFGSSISSIKNLIASDNFMTSWYNESTSDTFGFNVFTVSIAEARLSDLRFKERSKTKTDSESIRAEIEDIETRLATKDGLQLKQIVIEYISDYRNLETLHENGMYYRPTEDEFNEILDKENGDVSKLAKYAIINPSIEMVIFQNSDKTIGNSFGEAFQEIFEERNTVNSAVKTMDVVTSSSFGIKVEKSFEKLLSEKKDGGVITEAEFNKIINDLVESGDGHTIDYKDGNKQTLIKEDDGAGNQKRAFVKISKNSSGTSITIDIKRFKDNATASVVIPIHFLDGKIMDFAVRRTTNQSVYDAIIFGVDGKSNKVSGEYNTGVIEKTTGDNYFKRNYEKLVHMIDTVEVNDMVDKFSPVENITPSLIYEGRTKEYGFIKTEKKITGSGKNKKAVYIDSIVFSDNNSSQQDVTTQVLDDGKEIRIEYVTEKNGKRYINKVATMTRKENGKYTVKIEYQEAKVIKSKQKGRADIVTKNKFLKVDNIEIKKEFKTFDNPNIYENAQDIVVMVEKNNNSNDKILPLKDRWSKPTYFNGKKKNGKKVLTLKSNIDRTLTKKFNMRGAESIDKTLSTIGINPDENGNIYETIMSGVTIINDGVKNLKTKDVLNVNHLHVIGVKPKVVKVNTNIDSIDISEMEKVKTFFENVSKKLNDRKIGYLKEKYSNSHNKRIRDIVEQLIESYENTGSFDKFTYYSTDFNLSKSKMTEYQLAFFAEMNRLNLVEKIEWDDNERLEEVKENENHFKFYELFSYTGETNISMNDSSDLVFALAMSKINNLSGLITDKVNVTDEGTSIIPASGGRFGSKGKFTQFTSSQSKIYNTLRNMKNSSFHDKMLALNRMSGHIDGNNESIGNWVSNFIDEKGGLSFIRSITDKKIAKELESFYRWSKEDIVEDTDFMFLHNPIAEYSIDEINGLSKIGIPKKENANKKYMGGKLYIGKVDGRTDLKFKTLWRNNKPTKIDYIKNFNNPFSYNIKNHSRKGVEKYIPNITQEEANVMYFRWLVNNVIPEGFPHGKDGKNLELLKRRRSFILSRIGDVTKAKGFVVSNLKNENLSFAGHLFAASKIISRLNIEKSKNKKESDEKNFSGGFIPVKDENNLIDVEITIPKYSGKKKNKNETLEFQAYDARLEMEEVGSAKKEVVYLTLRTVSKDENNNNEYGDITYKLDKSSDKNGVISYSNKKGVFVTDVEIRKVVNAFDGRDRETYVQEEKIYRANKNAKADSSIISDIINRYKKRIKEGCK